MRNKLISFFSMIIIVLSVAGPVIAEEKTKEQLVRELFTEMKMEDTLKQLVEVMTAQMKEQAPAMFGSILDGEMEDLSDEQKNHLINDMMPDFMEKSMEVVFELFNIDMLLEDIYVPLYSKYFDEEDIVTMIEFYKTPAGKKMVEVTPALTGEATAIIMQSFGSDMGQKMKELSLSFGEQVEEYLKGTDKPAEQTEKE